jgi:hypothetical protein
MKIAFLLWFHETLQRFDNIWETAGLSSEEVCTLHPSPVLASRGRVDPGQALQPVFWVSLMTSSCTNTNYPLRNLLLSFLASLQLLWPEIYDAWRSKQNRRYKQEIQNYLHSSVMLHNYSASHEIIYCYGTRRFIKVITKGRLWSVLQVITSSKSLFTLFLYYMF